MDSAGKRDRPREAVGPDRDVGPSSGRSLDALARSVGHSINNALAALLVNLDGTVDALKDERQDPNARIRDALALLGEMRVSVGRIVRRIGATTVTTQPPPPTTDPPPRPSDFLRKAQPPEVRVRVRVLVIDDDELLRNALRRSLRDYDVVILDGARGALGRIASGERFDVIFCDLMMPDMTGMDLYEELGRVAPEQAERMVFLTGGAITTRAQDFVATVPNLVIEKPFPVQRLRDIIRSRLPRTTP